MSGNYFRDYFGFSKKEMNGIYVLLLLIFILMLLPFVFQTEVNGDRINIARYKQQITEFEQSVKTERAYSYRDTKPGTSDIASKAIYFPFNPNGLSETEWRKLGLSEKQIRVIKNYEAKGGKFYRKEDVQKMYVISPQTYQKLEPYIRIPVSSPSSVKSTKANMPLIDLNLADSAQLQSIKGLGPVFASRIIRYRDRLGGFYSKDQLREVFGLDSSKFAQWTPQFKLSISNLRKINVNTAEFNDFKKHPYLNYKQVNAIIQYRKQHGEFHALSDLSKIALLNAEILRKLEPYLQFQ